MSATAARRLRTTSAPEPPEPSDIHCTSALLGLPSSRRTPIPTSPWTTSLACTPSYTPYPDSPAQPRPPAGPRALGPAGAEDGLLARVPSSSCPSHQPVPPTRPLLNPRDPRRWGVPAPARPCNLSFSLSISAMNSSNGS